MFIKKLAILLFLFSAFSAFAVFNNPSRDIKNTITQWVMDRHHWRPTTRAFIEPNPQDPDAQILKRYLDLLITNTLDLQQQNQSLLSAAEQAVEYCPSGVADLHYILTGAYHDGPCIMILLTESMWLEHLADIEARIKNKAAL